jgi:hypothetical protein
VRRGVNVVQNRGIRERKGAVGERKCKIWVHTHAQGANTRCRGEKARNRGVEVRVKFACEFSEWMRAIGERKCAIREQIFEIRLRGIGRTKQKRPCCRNRSVRVVATESPNDDGSSGDWEEGTTDNGGNNKLEAEADTCDDG